MYTSTNLLDWTPCANPQNAIQYMWRPKLAKPNGSWWIYGQVDRNVQALKSSTINDNYAVSGGKVTLPPNGYTCMYLHPSTELRQRRTRVRPI